MSTLLVYAPAMAHTKQNHPESHDRMVPLMPALEKEDVLPSLTAVSPTLATTEQLTRVHTLNLIELIRQTSLQGGGLLDYGDTYATPESYELARLAAGGCCLAVDQIMTEQVSNGIALVRPPGHHAESDRVSGFCLFNNIAIAARQAQQAHGVKRLVILDFDVHHGNGTQEIFYQDDTVLFISIHLYAPFFYPGIGSLTEVGNAQGQGFTLNVPLPPYVGDVGYGRILHEIVYPRIVQFEPELLLISAGFDAHWQDPLAMAGLSLTGYAHMARALLDMADSLTNGRALFILEGGYKRDVLVYGILNVIYALVGQDNILDPIGPMNQPEQDITSLLDRLKRQHLLF